MAQIPQLSPQVRDMLTAKGYDANAVHEANRLPNFAIPGTTAYNLTTFALVGLSLAGIAYTKPKRLFSQGFTTALALTFLFDFMARRELDNTSILSTRSTATLQQELEKHPQFKKAFDTVSAELDAKIAALERQKLSQ